MECCKSEYVKLPRIIRLKIIDPKYKEISHLIDTCNINIQSI